MFLKLLGWSQVKVVYDVGDICHPVVSNGTSCGWLILVLLITSCILIQTLAIVIYCWTLCQTILYEFSLLKIISCVTLVSLMIPFRVLLSWWLIRLKVWALIFVSYIDHLLQILVSLWSYIFRSELFIIIGLLVLRSQPWVDQWLLDVDRSHFLVAHCCTGHSSCLARRWCLTVCGSLSHCHVSLVTFRWRVVGLCLFSFLLFVLSCLSFGFTS